MIRSDWSSADVPLGVELRLNIWDWWRRSLLVFGRHRLRGPLKETVVSAAWALGVLLDAPSSQQTNMKPLLSDGWGRRPWWNLFGAMDEAGRPVSPVWSVICKTVADNPAVICIAAAHCGEQRNQTSPMARATSYGDCSGTPLFKVKSEVIKTRRRGGSRRHLKRQCVLEQKRML